MRALTMMPTVAIILLIIGIVLAIALIVLVLYFLVFAQARLKRQAADIMGKYQKAHGILFGADQQYLKRLEEISGMNLVYVDIHQSWNKKYKDVMLCDADALSAHNLLRDLLSDRRFSELKKQIPAARTTIEDFAGRVEELTNGLQDRFKDEEIINTSLLAAKAAYRKIKADYIAHKGELVLLSDSFETLFGNIDSMFQTIDINIENARYEDAKTIITGQATELLNSLSKMMERLPSICLRITRVVPQKIVELSDYYDRLVNQGYHLRHIVTKEQIYEMNAALTDLGNQAKAFKTSGLENGLNAIENRIEDINRRFATEESAKARYEADRAPIYASVNDVQNRFIRLVHDYPSYKEHYYLDEADDNKIVEISTLNDTAAGTRRNLDKLHMQGNARPAYTVLLEKLDELREENAASKDAIDRFTDYLTSLKEDHERAGQAIADYAMRCREAEERVREFHLESISKRYDPQIEEIYGLIDLLYEKLRTTPAHIKEINQGAEILRSKADSMLASLDRAWAACKEAEDKIVYCARFRVSAPEIDQTIAQAQTLFRDGAFEQASSLADQAIEHAEALGTIDEK